MSSAEFHLTMQTAQLLITGKLAAATLHEERKLNLIDHTDTLGLPSLGFGQRYSPAVKSSADDAMMIPDQAMMITLSTCLQMNIGCTKQVN